MKLEIFHPSSVVPHPLLPEVVKTGPAWDAALSSMRVLGPVSVPMGRAVDGGAEIVSGVATVAAAAEIGLDALPCLVGEWSAKGSVQRMLVMAVADAGHVDPLRVAEMMEALAVEFYQTDADIAALIAKPASWVARRRRLLSLPEHVQVRLSLPADDEMRLSVEAAETLLEVHADDVEAAIRAVVFPACQLGPLSGKKAREVVYHALTQPRRMREEWQGGGAAKATESTRENLMGAAHLQGDIQVQAAEWGTRPAGVDPLARIPSAELVPGAHDAATWLDIAVRHGAPVIVYPPESPESSPIARVDASILRNAEYALAEGGGSAWMRRPTR